jgi:hypothetical protein
VRRDGLLHFNLENDPRESSPVPIALEEFESFCEQNDAAKEVVTRTMNYLRSWREGA